MRTSHVCSGLCLTSTLLFLVACSQNDQGTEGSTTTSPMAETTVTSTETSTSQSTTTQLSPAETPVQPLGSPDLQDKQQVPTGMNDMSIKGIRAGEHNGFTRVTVDIAGSGEPGWWTTYADEPLQQASGLPVAISGDSFLDIGIEGISYPDDALSPGIDPGTFAGSGIVEEVALTSIFEARAQLIIGLDGAPRNYSVTLLDNPTRVVIDIVE